MISETWNTKIITWFVTILLIGPSCRNRKQWNNQNQYNIQVGETLQIYYSTNSCCYYCWTNEDSCQHLSLVNQIVIEPGPDDCEGCNATYAFVLKAESEGTDTVKLNSVTAAAPCSTTPFLETYIVNVQK